MKVRVLESNRFYSNHFETDVPESEQHESVVRPRSKARPRCTS